jgi:hypothetical protein
MISPFKKKKLKEKPIEFPNTVVLHSTHSKKAQPKTCSNSLINPG